MISSNDWPRIVWIGRQQPAKALPGEFVEGPAPSLAELEDRAMTAYGPTEAGPNSVGIAVRLEGRAALAIQDRRRSIVVEAEGTGDAQTLLEWVLDGAGQVAPFPVRRWETIGEPEQIAVLHGERPAAAFPVVGPRRSWLIFPGSFHPFHSGHARLAEIAHELTGLPVDFEISVRNVDKPALHYRAMADRLLGLREHRERARCQGSAWLTSAPTFLEKARLFPGPSRFVVGMDTLVRIGDPRYYRDEADCRQVLEELADAHQASFLAFPRAGLDGRLVGPEAVRDLPAPLQAIVEIVPEERVRSVLRVSSTAIRAAAESRPGGRGLDSPD